MTPDEPKFLGGKAEPEGQESPYRAPPAPGPSRNPLHVTRGERASTGRAPRDALPRGNLRGSSSKPPPSGRITRERAPADVRAHADSRSEAAPPDDTGLGGPDRLTRALGPGRMPWFMIRHPRICGVVLVAVGAWLWHQLSEVAEHGGVYFVSVMGVAPAGLLLGSWLAIVGRPADEEGYSPAWWNIGFVSLLVIAAIIGLGWGFVLHD